ncbi:Agenet domain-containing protein [Heracleum sosnowskyi]|uniref:Agenet domain-containing protein n=1 Tax=Heracleum sosnowskyi TaxID=360622 RepID=A0AAD8JEL3_9APIA|nr:Agenet domain-containing protein [Heracleum sosnowskyi]
MHTKFWKVRCNGRKNEEGSGNLELEQGIPLPRLAPPANLSMRHTGRLTIRPCPPEEEPLATFEVGAAVDAWWRDGWWEGFVYTMESLSCNDNYYVFLPGPGKFLTVHRKDLRASRDWVDDTWVPIMSHPDILSFVFSYLDNSHNSPTR